MTPKITLPLNCTGEYVAKVSSWVVEGILSMPFSLLTYPSTGPDLLVPTANSTRFTYMLDLLVKKDGNPHPPYVAGLDGVLVVGPTGTGKTAMLYDYIQKVATPTSLPPTGITLVVAHRCVSPTLFLFLTAPA